ncbi:class I SAM-dependent methyltransferase [Kitasatospora sp. LaBMicrA B282]|uniref:class I SAM-dependent methyltransferase n=1 Tax=Kitasatospora sp. LaBMicrA B282 TaxID=3420949 RepID=UPI003D0F3172
MVQYDTIGKLFERSKTTAAFSAADTYSLLHEVGQVTGPALDLACGYGHNTRLLYERGAAPVRGVDISEEMIRLAREAEQRLGQGIEYMVADVATMPVLGAHQLATAVYLFNYAPTREALRSMFRAIRANLAPDGRLVAIVPNPCPFPESNWDLFHVTVRERLPTAEAPLLKAAFLIDKPVAFEFYEWQREDLEHAASEGGFGTVAWRPVITPPADDRFTEELWTAYRRTPVSSMMICHR